MEGILFKFRYRKSNSKAPRIVFIHPNATDEEIENVIKMLSDILMQDNDPNSYVNLSEVAFVVKYEDREKKIVSAIKDKDIDFESLIEYRNACLEYGESFFLFAEGFRSRNCLSPFIESRGIPFDSFAECGEHIAEEFLGVSQGVLNYLDATRLCEDVIAGSGPEEIPENIIVTTGPNGDPVYFFDVPDAALDDRDSPKM